MRMAGCWVRSTRAKIVWPRSDQDGDTSLRREEVQAELASPSKSRNRFPVYSPQLSLETQLLHHRRRSSMLRATLMLSALCSAAGFMAPASPLRIAAVSQSSQLEISSEPLPGCACVQSPLAQASDSSPSSGGLQCIAQPLAQST